MAQEVSTTELVQEYLGFDDEKQGNNNNNVNDMTVSVENLNRYCICQKPYDASKTMIRCDFCEEWYHLECLGISKNEMKNLSNSEWKCIICTGNNDNNGNNNNNNNNIILNNDINNNNIDVLNGNINSDDDKEGDNKIETIKKDIYSFGNSNEYILNNFNILCNNKDFSDVLFEIGDKKKEYYGIRALFGINSPVFHKMLYGNMFESKLDNTVTLLDMNTKTFEFLQLFFHGLNPSISNKNVVDIFKASDKYLIDSLKKSCIDFIISLIYGHHIKQFLSVIINLITNDLVMKIDVIIKHIKQDIPIDTCESIVLSIYMYIYVNITFLYLHHNTSLQPIIIYIVKMSCFLNYHKKLWNN